MSKKIISIIVLIGLVLASAIAFNVYNSDKVTINNVEYKVTDAKNNEDIILTSADNTEVKFVPIPDETDKDIFKVESPENIIVSNSYGGYLFKSVGEHTKTQTVIVSKSDLGRTFKSVENGWYRDDNGKYTILEIPIKDIGSYYEFDITLSELCVGCFVGTYQETFLNQVNSTNPTFSQTLTNLSEMTANITDFTTLSDPYAINTSGLVAWYHMDETTGILVNDYSNNGYSVNNGNWFGNTTINSTTGKYNTSLNFSTKNNVSISDNNSLDFNNFTLSIWIKSTQSLSSSFCVLGKWTDGVGGSFVIRNQGDGGIKISVNDAAQQTGIYSGYNNNKWHNIVGKYNKSYLTLYADNSIISSVSYTGTLSTNNKNITIGSCDNGIFYNGLIDEVKIYNRSLSTEEIQSQYYTHLQELQISAIGNGTLSNKWNSSSDNQLSIPINNTNTITGLLYTIPSFTIVNGITIYDYLNSTKWNLIANATFTQNSTVISHSATLGNYLFNSSINLSQDCDINCWNNFTITDTDYSGATYIGTPIFTSTDGNAVLHATQNSLNISSNSVTGGTLNYYNVSNSYNNAPITTLSDQNFRNEQTNVVFTATDPESNTLTCYGTILGTTINSCSSPHNFGSLNNGTYTYYLNVTDQNGTIGGAYVWTNKTATINVYMDFYPSVPILSSVVIGNFYVNLSWTPDNSLNMTDSYNVSTNGVWDNGSTNTYNNSTLSAHAWANRTIYAFNGTYGVGRLSLTALTSNVQIPNNPVILTPIGDKTVNEGQSLTFTVTSTDADSDTPLYSSTQTEGTFDVNTGEFSWTPDSHDSGIYIWTFGVTDGYGSSDSEIVIVTVNNVPLQITSYSPLTDPTSQYLVPQSFSLDINYLANITWYVDGVLKQTNNNVVTSTYTNSTALAGTHTITGIVSDGETLEHSWIWTVIPKLIVLGSGSSTAPTPYNAIFKCQPTVIYANFTNYANISTVTVVLDNNMPVRESGLVINSHEEYLMTGTGSGNYYYNYANDPNTPAGNKNIKFDVWDGTVHQIFQSGITLIVSPDKCTGTVTSYKQISTGLGSRTSKLIVNYTNPISWTIDPWISAWGYWFYIIAIFVVCVIIYMKTEKIMPPIIAATLTLFTMSQYNIIPMSMTSWIVIFISVCISGVYYLIFVRGK